MAPILNCTIRLARWPASAARWVSRTSRKRGVGTNLVWTPLAGFDIGAEFMYALLNQTRPVGLAPDAVLTATGLPAFKPATSQYSTRLRIQRAF